MVITKIIYILIHKKGRDIKKKSNFGQGARVRTQNKMITFRIVNNEF